MLRDLGSGYFQEIDDEADIKNNLSTNGAIFDTLSNNFKEYDITVTGTNSWSTVMAKARPFQMTDDSWWCAFTIDGTTSSAAGTTLTISAVTFFNGADQCLAGANDQNAQTRAICNSNASTIAVTSAGGTTATDWQVSGAVRLNAKPTFVVEDFSFPSTVELTSWVSYTPTYTGFGTVSTQSAWYKRFHDSIFLKGRFTAGTATATEARLSLPSGLTSSNTDIDSVLELAGLAVKDTATDGVFNTLIERNVTYLTFSRQSADASSPGLIKRNGDELLGSGEEFSWQAGPFPIAEWES